MSEENWHPTSVDLPANDQKVYWMDSCGNVHEGFYLNGLWFTGNMYVYYTPQFWKPRKE